MNPQDEIYELEQVTAESLPPGTVLSAESAWLREAWLSLGQLLEAADADFDEVQWVQRLQAERDRRVRRRWWSVAIAAAALLAGSLTWAMSRTGPTPVVRPDSVAETLLSRPTPSPNRPRSPNDQPAGDVPAWDDRLDASFTSLVSTLDTATGSASAPLDARLTLIDEALQQVRRETWFDSSSLSGFESRVRQLDAELSDGSL